MNLGSLSKMSKAQNVWLNKITGVISLWLWFSFPQWLVMLNIFTCACWPSAFPLWKNVCSVFVFFLMLSCIICLYMLDINPLLVISLTNILSHSVSCLFILLIISFAVQKLLSLIRFQLFLFPLLQEMDPKKLLQFMLKSALPMFYSRNFIVFSLTFRSLIYFEFIFVYGIRECSNFILLQVAVQFSQHHILKRLFFHCIFLLPLS